MPFTRGITDDWDIGLVLQRSHILTGERHLETALQEHNDGSIAAFHTCREERKGPYRGCDWFDGKYLIQNIPLITQLDVLEWKGAAQTAALQAEFLCAWERASQKTATCTCSFHSEAWAVILKEWCTHQLHQQKSPGVFANHSRLGPLNIFQRVINCPGEWILTKKWDMEWKREDHEHLSPSVSQLYNLYQEG